jgi:hypothetical protein
MKLKSADKEAYALMLYRNVKHNGTLFFVSAILWGYRKYKLEIRKWLIIPHNSFCQFDLIQKLLQVNTFLMYRFYFLQGNSI